MSLALLGAATLNAGCAGDGDATAGTPETAVTTPGDEIVDVVEVIDGDTLEVRRSDGQRERVRLIGINTPEQGECLAEEATERLRSLAGDTTVRMAADRTDRDGYGRLLRYLYADDVFLNEQMVADGLALARRYEPDTAQSQRLEAAQRGAQRREIGQWASDACGEPQEHEGDLSIGELQADAPGNDDNNSLNGEWVEVANLGQASVGLEGWALKDTSASHRYTFPAGFTLEPGATVRISSGCGTDSRRRLYWCVKGSAVWNNDADTAYLLDPSGNIVDTHAYG
ncbi:MAG: lamin tail domain-containing protein [Microthrixaceae bacterium]